MTVQSYVMVRAGRDPETNGWGPRPDDLAPYNLSGEDVTGRASGISDGAAFLNAIEAPPQVMVWRFRMNNADALAMSNDPKVWMIRSKRYEDRILSKQFRGIFTADGVLTEVDEGSVTADVYEGATLMLSDQPVQALADATDFYYTVNDLELPPDSQVEYYVVFKTTDPLVDNQEVSQFSMDNRIESVVIQNDRDTVYDSDERLLRINQLSNITGFDYETIEGWWTPEKTRQEVAEKLIRYLRNVNA